VHAGRSTPWFGRKVALLPDRGVLLFATDLQGNYDDYRALQRIYFDEKDVGNEPVLLFCGDLVHGPGPRLARAEDWPDHLGTFYRDRSAEIILDFMDFCLKERAFSLLGNHEHAHVGGPVVSKFHDDEAAALEEQLGTEVDRVRAFMATFPLLAVSACGAVFTHGAPRGTEPNLEAFERLDYEGYRDVSINAMFDIDTVGALLWSRGASAEHARALLDATRPGEPGGFVAYGHDIVREGFEKVGREQLCLSTSFGCDDANKYYLRLDLGSRYDSVEELRVGEELRKLHPDAV